MQMSGGQHRRKARPSPNEKNKPPRWAANQIIKEKGSQNKARRASETAIVMRVVFVILSHSISIYFHYMHFYSYVNEKKVF